MVNWMKSKGIRETMTMKRLGKGIIPCICFILLFAVSSVVSGGGNPTTGSETPKKQTRRAVYKKHAGKGVSSGSVNQKETTTDYAEIQTRINKLKQDMKILLDERDKIAGQLENEVKQYESQINTLNTDGKQKINEGKKKIAAGEKEVREGEKYIRNAEEVSKKKKQPSELLDLLKDTR